VPPTQRFWSRFRRALFHGLAAALLAGLLAGTLPLLFGVSPKRALEALLSGAFGVPGNPRATWFAWSGTLLRVTPILLCGLAVSWALRGGMFNIGAEGQLLWGALAAAWIGTWRIGPAPVHVTLALLTGAAAGALWALPATLLKVRRGTPEVVSTLLLTFVATHWTTFLAGHPLHDPNEQGARTPEVLSTALLPVMPNGRLHAGLAVAVSAVILTWLILRSGRAGFGLAVTGQSPEAARSGGIRVNSIWLTVLLQSGALAGLAGAIEVLGVHRFFQAGFSPGYGYEGIAVAILGGNRPPGVLLAALLWGGLANGAVEMEVSTGVSRYLVTVIQALVVLSAAVRRWPVPTLRARPPRASDVTVPPA
jgi:simple sugar transport system permease protein